ncbi:hypothetical protein GCM10010211_39720 [Streptomyces albospinus]|uniref:Uncharacterized protein n=1 Tax=Streptomyces albospinus TaxID=285515 RepID=A0ABQ2V5N9_9ACTN|nr:hypothetical protein [Streptomyces albospinus]GGU70133.1 hypothetical protein GCM10010211_39720 [Streptomyces albospinus]
MPQPRPLTVRRVFGDQPYTEVGHPGTAVRDERLGLLAVAGGLRHPQWPGRDAAKGWTRTRIGVYDADAPRCRQLLRARWSVSALRFHPTLPLLAIGTGAWSHEGELLLLNLASGRVLSLLAEPRNVCGLRWSDARTLEVFLTPDDDVLEAGGDSALRAVVEHDDWSAAGNPTSAPSPGELHPYDSELELVALPPDDRVPPLLAQIDGAAPGPRRGPVWAVESLPGGRILAALEGTRLECWGPDGTREWSAPDPDPQGGGREILLAPDRRSAWVNTSARTRWDGHGWHERPYPIDRLSVDDGTVRTTVDPGFAVACTRRADGWLALRDCRHSVARPVTVLVSPGHREAVRLELGGYDLFNHHFPVRHSPELLFLQGESTQPAAGKQIVRVDPPDGTTGTPRIHRLFPLEWDADRDAHLFGGPAVHLADGRGPALVHAGTVHHPHGLRPGGAFVVRRRMPDGAPDWVFTTDTQTTGLDTDGETVYVAGNSGEVVALCAADGTVRDRRTLRIDGFPADPLSLTAAGPDRVLIGTVDGRIADCTF